MELRIGFCFIYSLLSANLLFHSAYEVNSSLGLGAVVDSESSV